MTPSQALFVPKPVKAHALWSGVLYAASAPPVPLAPMAICPPPVAASPASLHPAAGAQAALEAGPADAAAAVTNGASVKAHRQGGPPVRETESGAEVGGELPAVAPPATAAGAPASLVLAAPAAAPAFSEISPEEVKKLRVMVVDDLAMNVKARSLTSLTGLWAASSTAAGTSRHQFCACLLH